MYNVLEQINKMECLKIKVLKMKLRSAWKQKNACKDKKVNVLQVVLYILVNFKVSL